MTEIMLRKEFGGLRPDGDASYQAVSAIKNGACVVATIKDQSRRSTKQHKYFFAILNILYESQELYTNFDHFRASFLISLGRCKVYPTKDGDRAIADSVAFGNMSADDFKALLDSTLDFAERIGFDKNQLEAQARERSGYE
ncbi:MAG: hypothetical protein KAI73_08625 [Rhodospirillaceae bacterium]|nr:hypothetical protein [Rhodospirillaceae bacterium]